METLKYIQKLCTIAREKSLLGCPEDASYYFVRAIACAEHSADFLCIAQELYRSDLENNKNLAYNAFVKSIEVANEPMRLFKKMLKRRDLIQMLGEFLIKKPDQLFHHLLLYTQNEHEVDELNQLFEPLAIYIEHHTTSRFLRKAC